MKREAMIANRIVAGIDIGRVLGRWYRVVHGMTNGPWMTFEYIGPKVKSRVEREVIRTLDEEGINYRSVEVRSDGIEKGLSSSVYVIIEKS